MIKDNGKGSFEFTVKILHYHKFIISLKTIVSLSLGIKHVIFNSIRMNTLSILIKDKSLISKEIEPKTIEAFRFNNRAAESLKNTVYNTALYFNANNI